MADAALRCAEKSSSNSANVIAGAGAEEAAPFLQPGERILAVAPFVVAGNEKKGMADARELLPALEQPCVTARLGARTDIADVDHELELLCVDALDDCVEPLDLPLAVRHVAQHAEGPRARRQRHLRGAAHYQKAK